MENQVSKSIERRKHRRFKELNLQLANAIDETTANYEMWVEPSIYESGSENGAVCACCGANVEDNPLKIFAGDHGLHAHINCIMMDCMKSPDFQAVLFWEELGFKLSKVHEDLIVSAMASGSVLAAYSHHEKTLVPDVRRLNVKFSRVQNTEKSDFAIPVAAYSQKAVDENHRTIRNRVRSIAGLPPTEDIEKTVETPNESVTKLPTTTNVTDEDMFLEL